MSTVHCCFVRVHRTSGSCPSGEVEGEPWFVLKDRLLRVKETRSDDPAAELMVSFLIGSHTLLSALEPSHLQLELRLQVRVLTCQRAAGAWENTFCCRHGDSCCCFCRNGDCWAACSWLSVPRCDSCDSCDVVGAAKLLLFIVSREVRDVFFSFLFN